MVKQARATGSNTPRSKTAPILTAPPVTSPQPSDSTSLPLVQTVNVRLQLDLEITLKASVRLVDGTLLGQSSAHGRFDLASPALAGEVLAGLTTTTQAAGALPDAQYGIEFREWSQAPLEANVRVYPFDPGQQFLTNNPGSFMKSFLQPISEKPVPVRMQGSTGTPALYILANKVSL